MEKLEMERKLRMIVDPWAGNNNDPQFSIINNPYSTTKKVGFSQNVPTLDTLKKELETGIIKETLLSTFPSSSSLHSSNTITNSVISTQSNQDQTISSIIPKMEKQWSKGPTSGTSTPVRRRSSPAGTIMNEIRKMSLASQDALEDRKLKRFRRFHGKRRKRREEEYTDKDRAAAVTLGFRDIKQSLKAKKKRDRKLCVSVELMNQEDFLSDMLVHEATHQIRVKDIPLALSTLNKALEIQPLNRGALVVRSQCHLKLGDAHSALKDAKASCESRDDTFLQGLLQYAEALYNLGQFEKALIAYHRGHRRRPEKDSFRIGIEKCQQAIQKCIGDLSTTQINDVEDILPIIYEIGNFRNQPETNDVAVGQNLIPAIQMASKNSSFLEKLSRDVLGKIYNDKIYFKKILGKSFLTKTSPEESTSKGSASIQPFDLKEVAVEALEYLQIREEFWRQQNPIYSRKKGSLNKI